MIPSSVAASVPLTDKNGLTLLPVLSGKASNGDNTIVCVLAEGGRFDFGYVQYKKKPSEATWCKITADAPLPPLTQASPLRPDYGLDIFYAWARAFMKCIPNDRLNGRPPSLVVSQEAVNVLVPLGIFTFTDVEWWCRQMIQALNRIKSDASKAHAARFDVLLAAPKAVTLTELKETLVVTLLELLVANADPDIFAA